MIDIPSLPPPSDLPPTLARFRTYGSEYAAGADKAAVYDALRGRLLFKNGATFNDPFEGKPHYVPASSDPQKQRYILGKYLRLIARQGRFPSPNRWAEEQMQRKTLSEITEWMISISKKQDKSFVHLLCLMHPDVIATTLPWSHYADSHCGVCIEFDAAIQPVYFAMPVSYSADYPTLKVPRIAGPDSDEMEKAFLTKSAEWAYEKEYRVVRPVDPDAGISEHLFVKWQGDVAVTRPEIAKTLTLGAKMPLDLREELVKWVRANAPHVKLFQADLHPSKFEITRSPIL